MNTSQTQGLDLQKVYEKCWNDASFKAELIAAPQAALRAHFNFELDLPEGVQVKAYDLTDQTKSYLPLPAEPNWEEMELSDEQLELVAGGELALSGTAIATYIISAVTVAGVTYLAGRIFG